MIFQTNTLVLIAITLLLAGCDAQYSYGQATYYNSIENGYVPGRCGGAAVQQPKRNLKRQIFAY